MKIMKILLLSITLIILISNIVGFSFAHPGHGSEYPEEVTSSSSSSDSSHNIKSSAESSSKKTYKSSNQKSVTKKSTNTKEYSSKQLTNTKSSNNKVSGSEKIISQPDEKEDVKLEQINQSNDSMDVEEVLSSNNTKKDKEIFFNLNNILVIIIPFITGFGIIVAAYKIKNN